jgi:large subunit ribosomal protein L10
MDNPRPEKVAVVNEVRARFEATEAVVVTEYRGLDVPAMADLRKSLSEAGGEYKIYKNTLVRLAARELNLEIEEFLIGPTALAFTSTRPDGSPGDPVNVAKVLRDFGKAHEELVIKGGLLGDELLDSSQIMKLASIAPREELLASFAGLLAAPLQQFAGLLAALPRDFAYGLQALIEKSGGLTEAEQSAEGSDEPAEGSDEPAEGSDEAEQSGEGDEAADTAEDSAAVGDEADQSGEGDESAAASDETDPSSAGDDTADSAEDSAEAGEQEE